MIRKNLSKFFFQDQNKDLKGNKIVDEKEIEAVRNTLMHALTEED